MYTILNPFNNLLFPNTAPYEVVNKRWMDGLSNFSRTVTCGGFTREKIEFQNVNNSNKTFYYLSFLLLYNQFLFVLLFYSCLDTWNLKSKVDFVFINL